MYFLLENREYSISIDSISSLSSWFSEVFPKARGFQSQRAPLNLDFQVIGALDHPSHGASWLSPFSLNDISI